MLEKQDLIHLSNQTMPFGKYQGKYLMEIPEEYYIWFIDRGFPAGRLGELMQLALELKVNGLDHLLDPLRNQ